MKCKLCLTEKEISDFNKNRFNKSGFCGLCKSCLQKRRLEQGFDTPEWNTWKNMHARCKRPIGRSKCYSGVIICQEWSKFNKFLSDMGKRPDGMTLDRIDSKLGYSKENCRWATPKEQANNRTNSRKISYNNSIVTFEQLEQLTGINRRTLWDQIAKDSQCKLLKYEPK